MEELAATNEQLSREHNDQFIHLQRVETNSRESVSKFEQLKAENRQLHEDIAELENKNRQLFDNLQRELAQRAKEYRERTMSMLNTPMRPSPLPVKTHEATPKSPPGFSASKEADARSPSDAASGLLNVLHQYSPEYHASPRPSPGKRYH